MITREDVADLREGDVVELRDDRWPGVVIRGPVRITDDRRSYAVGEVGLAPNFLPEYRQPYGALTRTLTVVSRAPRRCYVNHDRTEPVPGDVVRDADSDSDTRTWVYAPVEIGDGRLSNPWTNPADSAGYHQLRGSLPARLRLLVDGETGRCVP